MGNEHSESKETTKNGTIPEKHENGAVNGFSANITSNGLEIGVNKDTIIHQNGKTPSLNPGKESNEPDSVMVESDSQHTDAVISKTPDTTIQKEEIQKNKEEKTTLFGKMFKKKADALSVEVKKTNEDQTDVSLPVTDPQPESDSSGEDALATIIVEHPEEFERTHQKADISTQTDVKTEMDISTQTGDDNDSTANNEGPIEEVVVIEMATIEEHSLDESAVIIAEEVVEDTTNDNRTAGFIITEVVNIGNNVYENIVLRAERVDVTDNFEISYIKNYNPVEESINGSEETQPEFTTEPELNPNESIVLDEIAAEANVMEECEQLEVSSSLPKVVADCIEAVFAAVSESSDYDAINTSEPQMDEVITVDDGEGAGGMSADVALIETVEPEPNAVTPEAGEAIGVPSQDADPVIKVMETIFEVVYEEPNPIPGDQDPPVEEPSVPLEIEILVKMESAHAAVEDVPEKLSPVSDDEPSEKKCDSCSEEEMTIEELPEDSLTSPGDEIQIKLQSIPEIIITEVEDVIATVPPETDEQSQVSYANVKEHTEVIPEAAIDALSQELESRAVTSPESAADDASPVEEEVLSATVFVPLSAEQQASFTIPEEPVEETIVPSKDEIDAEEMKDEAIQALSNEFEAAQQIVTKDTTVKELSTDGEVAISEEHETDYSGDVSATDADSTEDSQIAAAYESVAACVEAIVEEIITEDGGEGKCNLVTSEAVTRESVTEAEEKAEDGSSANTTVPSPDQQENMEAVLEATNRKQESEALTEQKSVTPETDKPVEDQKEGKPEENPVMNFFKTLVAQVSEPPAAPKGMSIPPPPPPEPPKVEIKGEPAAKPVKATPKEEAKAAAKEPETSQGKSAKNTLTKFFRPKTTNQSVITITSGILVQYELTRHFLSVLLAFTHNKNSFNVLQTIKETQAVDVEVQPGVEVQGVEYTSDPLNIWHHCVLIYIAFLLFISSDSFAFAQSGNKVEPQETAGEVAQPVVEEQMVEEVPPPAEKVDPSKANTLEAAEKPEPPPPVQEETKTAAKPSFLSLFKPKAAETKKATPAPAAAAEAAQTVKAKEEPKAAGKSSEAVVDNKLASVASQAGDDAANAPRKLEKRNSIHLFFKILGQKRNSTDAGVQTEPVVVAPAAEKTK
ncbi:hypothetical protein PAMP_012514 [Pampus punctatissimus]